MAEQLQLEVEPRAPDPNAWMFNADGSPKRLLWCSDDARGGGPCPYAGRAVPCGVCCKELVRG